MPQDCIWTNRASKLLEDYGEVYVDMIHAAIAGEDLGEICKKAGAWLRAFRSLRRHPRAIACQSPSHPLPPSNPSITQAPASASTSRGCCR